MPSDRSLDITVDVIGTQASDGSYSGTATYTQTGSLPPMKLVAPNGDIDLGNLSSHADYNWAIGIIYTLNAVVTDRKGNNVPCTWATPLDKACAITGPGGVPAKGMIVSQLGPMLTIANANDDRDKAPIAERTYTYKLGVMLPSVNNYFIGLDPQITNTGPPTGGG